MQNAKDLILKNKEVNAFVKEHNVSIDKNLIPLYSYVTKKAMCDKCNGLDECSQAVRGQMATLDINGERVEVAFTPCEYRKKDEELNNFPLSIPTVWALLAR